ncbi:MAG: ATP-binding protein [Halobacteriota archaeon]
MELRIGDSFSVDPSDIITERSAVIGQSGSGKSYLVSVICEELARNNLGFVVIDTESEYSGLSGHHGINVIDDVDDVEDLAKDKARVTELIQRSQKIVLDVSEAEPKVVDKFLDSVYKVGTELFRQGAHNQIPFLIIVEEADIYIPQRGRGLEVLQVISRRGRKRGLGILFATQRPALVNKNVLSQCNNVFIGKLTLKNDIDSVRIFFSSLDDARQLTTLEPGHFYVQGSISDPGFIKVRERKTQHGGATPTIRREEPVIAERSSDAVPVPPAQPAARVPSEAMRIRLALDLTQGAKRVNYLAFDEGRIVDVVTSKKRNQKFKIFRKSESLSDVSLRMAPIFKVSIREIKKGLMGARSNHYTVLFDAISGNILSADGVHRQSRNLRHLIGCNANQLRLMDFILNNRGISYAKLHDAFPERRIKTQLKKLEDHHLISVNDERYYPLHDIQYPKSLEAQRADSLQLREGRVDDVLPARLQKKDLKELIRGLYPRCDALDTAVIYSPVIEVLYASEESNRHVRIDGLTGKVVRST